MNWTGTPGPEPLGIRASVRHSVWRYRIVELGHARLDQRRIGGTTNWRWSKQLIGEPPSVRARIDTLMPDGSSFYTHCRETYADTLSRELNAHTDQERAA